ncbi:hypothetical protein HanIR_Chr02g0082071 [Helianthus annuus]|nr:hypothetical protein HanIR_Chr02g0082071 [Helianthus annuus]
MVGVKVVVQGGGDEGAVAARLGFCRSSKRRRRRLEPWVASPATSTSAAYSAWKCCSISATMPLPSSKRCGCYSWYKY